jgi:hypothetical protein
MEKVHSYPLAWPQEWPRTERRQRKSSQFRTKYLDAWENLQKELKLLGASNVTISSNASLRRDGKPYSEAMSDDLDDPGVAIWFSMKGTSRAMARDCYLTPAENLHALGHVVEAMRTINRHGGSYMSERTFSAFVALPAPGAKVRSWREVLGFAASANPRLEDIEAAYRQAAKRRHPDVPGGSTEAMAELNAARDAAQRESSK